MSSVWSRLFATRSVCARFPGASSETWIVPRICAAVASTDVIPASSRAIRNFLLRLFTSQRARIIPPRTCFAGVFMWQKQLFCVQLSLKWLTFRLRVELFVTYTRSAQNCEWGTEEPVGEKAAHSQKRRVFSSSSAVERRDEYLSRRHQKQFVIR